MNNTNHYIPVGNISIQSIIIILLVIIILLLIAYFLGIKRSFCHSYYPQPTVHGSSGASLFGLVFILVNLAFLYYFSLNPNIGKLAYNSNNQEYELLTQEDQTVKSLEEDTIQANKKPRQSQRRQDRTTYFYVVQLSSFTKLENAKRYQQDMVSIPNTRIIYLDEMTYIVVLGKFRTQEAATQYMRSSYPKYPKSDYFPRKIIME